MSRIHGKDTDPEVRLRRELWAAGLRYRIHYKITGRPDIVFPRARVAIFVDGCFWHGCPVHSVRPKANSRFWATKLEGNIARDNKVNAELNTLGWKVIRIWEHDVYSNIEKAVNCVVRAVRGKSKRRAKGDRLSKRGR